MAQSISWLALQLPSVSVLFLTDDRSDLNLPSDTFQTALFTEYITKQAVDTPELAERLDRGASRLGEEEDSSEGGSETPFSAYRFPTASSSSFVLPPGFLEGPIFIDETVGWEEGKVLITTSTGAREGVLVRGASDMNRALDGDIVIMELLPGLCVTLYLSSFWPSIVFLE